MAGLCLLPGNIVANASPWTLGHHSSSALLIVITDTSILSILLISFCIVRVVLVDTFLWLRCGP